jgi:hypothetical protein
MTRRYFFKERPLERAKSEGAVFLRDVQDLDAQARAAKRWRSASLQSKIVDLDDLIDFVLRNCPKRARILTVEFTRCELARVAIERNHAWFYTSSMYPRIEFELRR